MRQLSEKRYKLISYVIIVLSIGMSIFFGTKKHGYFIDENYTYTLSNGTQLGIEIKNGEWNDTAPFLEQMISTGDENFHFAQACENTANDVHPPVYYILFHFLSSVFSGIYSKWIGLSLNLILLIPILFVVRNLAYELSGGNTKVTLISMAFYGISPTTISNTMLIRMYLLLSLWALLYAYLHVCDLKRDKLSYKFLIPAALVGYLGFLTQYFFVVIMFFITFVYAFYLLVFCKRVRDAILYGLSMVLALFLAAVTWPICKFHIFKGYRGKGAVNQILSIGSYYDRTRTYLEYLDKNVFGGLFIPFLVLLLIGILLIVLKCVKGTKLKDLPIEVKGMILLGISAILDFLVIAQTGLLAGEASCRHMYTAYAIFLVLIPTGLFGILKYLLGKIKRFDAVETERVIYYVLTVFVAVILIAGFAQKQVLFVYEDEKAALDYADEHPDAKVVVFQLDNGMYDSRIQEFVKYPKVYFASVNDLSTAKDETIANADELLVYVSNEGDFEEECFNSIFEQNQKLTKAEHLWDSNYFFKVYLLN